MPEWRLLRLTRERCVRYKRDRLPKTTHRQMSRLDRFRDWTHRAREAQYSASRLAKLCGVSQSQLRRFFNEMAGMPPQRWLNELRLWHAMAMLWNGSSVKEVAITLRFSSPSHFCNKFKEYHGCTPTRALQIYSELMDKRRKKHADFEGYPNTLSEPWKDAERALEGRMRGIPNRLRSSETHQSN